MLISFKDSQEAMKNQGKEYAPGVYKVRVKNVSEGVWKQAGSEYLEVELETMGEEVFTVKHRFTKSQKALSILLNFLSAIGIYDKESQEDLHFENEDLLGSILQVEFVKGKENDNGKSYLELKPWSCEAVGGLATPTVEKENDTTIGEEECPF